MRELLVLRKNLSVLVDEHRLPEDAGPHITRMHLAEILPTIISIPRLGNPMSRLFFSFKRGNVVSPLFVRWKSGTSSKRWVARQMDDAHTKKSKAEGYRSRAAYKLIEIDSKFRLFNKNTRNIVDLGFAPGAWTQVALARCKSKNITPRILGVDLINCSPPEGSLFLQGDIFSKKTHSEIVNFFDPEGHSQPLDLVMSDMMANTSGIKDNDHFASMDLCDGVLILACRLLKKNGNLVMKFYTGKEERLLQNKLEKVFHKVFMTKPAACRAELREMYFVALKKRTDVVLVEDVFSQEHDN